MRPVRRSRGFTLIELLVVVSIIALLMAILLPSLSRSREIARRAKCAAQLRAIATAYELWSADNGGFLPPRCRSAGGKCLDREVVVGADKSQTITRMIPYAGTWTNGLRIVGNAPPRHDAPDPPQVGNTAHFIDVDDRPLNRYIAPQWQPGARFEVTECPSDVNTLKAPGQDPYPRGFPRDTVGSCYNVHGTSYGTNIATQLPWRGHGPWATAIEAANNLKSGPNFNPNQIHSASRYVVSIDMANFYENWEDWLNNFDVGRKSNSGRWHEANVSDPWQNANAMFADGHVCLGVYYIPRARATLPRLRDYVRPEWSLYPLKYIPQN